MSGIEDEIVRLERQAKELRDQLAVISRKLDAARGEVRRDPTSLRGIRIPLKERMIMVEEALAVRGSLRLKDLAAAIEVSVPRAIDIIKALEEEGRVARKRGLIHLPENLDSSGHASED